MQHEPSDLTNELKIARALLAQEQAAGRTGSCTALLTTIGRLAKLYDDMLIRSSQVISKGALCELALMFGDIIIEELAELGTVSDWQQQDIIERIMSRLAATISTAENTQQDKNLLLGRVR